MPIYLVADMMECCDKRSVKIGNTLTLPGYTGYTIEIFWERITRYADARITGLVRHSSPKGLLPSRAEKKRGDVYLLYVGCGTVNYLLAAFRKNGKSAVQQSQHARGDPDRAHGSIAALETLKKGHVICM